MQTWVVGLIIASGILFSGCGMFQNIFNHAGHKYEKGIRKMVENEASQDDVLLKFGNPDEKVKASDGRESWVYKRETCSTSFIFEEKTLVDASTNGKKCR